MDFYVITQNHLKVRLRGLVQSLLPHQEDAAGDSSLVWPIVPPACGKQRLFSLLPARLQHLCFFRPWLEQNEGTESVLSHLGVLPASCLPFLPFEDLGLPISVGAADPGQLQKLSNR